MYTMQHEIREDLPVRRALVLGTTIFGVMLASLTGLGFKSVSAERGDTSCIAVPGMDLELQHNPERVAQLQGYADVLAFEAIQAAEAGDTARQQELTAVLLTRIGPAVSDEPIC